VSGPEIVIDLKRQLFRRVGVYFEAFAGLLLERFLTVLIQLLIKPLAYHELLGFRAVCFVDKRKLRAALETVTVESLLFAVVEFEVTVVHFRLQLTKNC
jgi:succinate dehydrogenase hydrophobic anchor subunit